MDDQPKTLAEYNARNEAHAAAFTEMMANFSERTKNQPTHHVSHDAYLTILRDGKDAEGSKVIDRYSNEGGVCNLTVEMADGQWRVYSVDWELKGSQTRLEPRKHGKTTRQDS